MKPVIVIVILTAVIIAGGCLTLYALESESQRLNQSLTELEDAIDKQNWEEAQKQLEGFHGRWDKTSSVWSTLIDHYEIDNIELVLSELTSYIKTRDKNQALAQVSSLKALIRHIPAKESFTLKNVL